MQIRSIEIVEDRTAASRCNEGFLKLSRLTLRNHYADGSQSETYACDVVTRPGSDAVAAVLYEVNGERRIHVLMRENTRPPIYLRRLGQFEHPDRREYPSLVEVVAGMVESGDGAGSGGLARRAALEAWEEAGVKAESGDFEVIGDESFASPGMSDEKLYFCAAAVKIGERAEPPGDGSVMEESGGAVVRELVDAIEACRRGEIPDMKTEIALLRLADHLGYLPQLRAFADELPAEWRKRYQRLGVGA